MLPPVKKFRVALVAWEPGRPGTGFGTKIGGLGAVMEELPAELYRLAAERDLPLEIVLLSPCFGHYHRSILTALAEHYPVWVNGKQIFFDAFEKVLPVQCQTSKGKLEAKLRLVYFWDDWQLNWTNERNIYPDDPWMGLRLYASLSQAFASYINQGNFQSIHLHDYHVGLTVFYLDERVFDHAGVHLTIHNASYQGTTPPEPGKGYQILADIGLPGHKFYHHYFDYFDKVNVMKAAMLRVHELGGKLTTVSGDLQANWGYAAELRESYATVWAKAAAQKGSPPFAIFHSNQGLDLFEKLPIAGITNGMSIENRPENLPALKASALQAMQRKRGEHNPFFANAGVQATMLGSDHSFDANRLHVKADLKRLLHLEAFGHVPWGNPIMLVTVGRLVEQKNLGLIADAFPGIVSEFPDIRLLVLASAADASGKYEEGRFQALQAQYPGRVYYRNDFNLPLSKLILAGGDFALVPSRFEPCGLVDYEASLLGTVVIGRRTGGLAKVGGCGYLYDWLDIGDRQGEIRAFTNKVREAFRNYYDRPEVHGNLMRKAMSIDASWDQSANTYLDMYLYGLLVKQWKARRKNLIEDFISELVGNERDMFSKFFMPAIKEYGDRYDWELRDRLS